MKQLLAAQELIFPRLYGSIQAALMPLMSKNRTGLETRKLDGDPGHAADAASSDENKNDKKKKKKNNNNNNKKQGTANNTASLKQQEDGVISI